MKSTIWAVVALAFISLAGNIFQHLTYKEEIEFYTTRVEVLEDSLRATKKRTRETEIDITVLNSVIDSLFNNPIIEKKYIDRWETKTDTVFVKLPSDAKRFFEEAVEYSGENSLSFNKLVTSEGDTLTISVAHKILIEGYIDSDKKFYLTDESTYWLERLEIIKRHINVNKKPSRKMFETYFGIVAHGNFEYGRVSLLVGGNLTVDNNLQFSIFGNSNSLQVGVGYNIMSKFGF